MKRLLVLLTVVSVPVLLLGCAAPAATQSASKSVAVYPGQTGTLTILTDVEGAEVFIDGELWGNVVNPQGHNCTLPAGLHTVEVKSPGYLPYQSTVRVAVGNQHPLLVRLKPAPGADAERARENAPRSSVIGRMVGNLSIFTDAAGAAVYVDGQFYGNVIHPDDSYSLQLPVGEHRVVLKLEGMKAFSETIFITPNNPHRLAVEMGEKKSARARPSAIEPPSEAPPAPEEPKPIYPE